MRLVAVMFILTGAGALAGCSGDNDSGNGSVESKTLDAENQEGAVSSGSIQVAGRTITFTPDTCMTSNGETLVSGPGEDEDGTPVYVDLDAMSATEGELRVDVGSDQKFSSSDEILRAAPDTGDFSVTSENDEIAVKGQFADGNNTSIGAGVMEVRCQ